LVRPDQYRREDEIATVVLFVVKVGPTAYKDAKFEGVAWCKAGDFIIVRTYSGTRFKIHGREFRMINDDQVEGTVQDPRGLSRHHV
jgi:co-chaperonin GroES (HSP10)